MSYIEKLDKKASINKARIELEHFSDLFQLHSTSSYYNNINSINYDVVISVMNYISEDNKMVNKISKNDDQIDEIKKVLLAISKLKDQHLEYIFKKYVLVKRNCEIDKELNISSRTRQRLSEKALFEMALSLGVEVEKEE